jgi:hypothetical protein
MYTDVFVLTELYEGPYDCHSRKSQPFQLNQKPKLKENHANLLNEYIYHICITYVCLPMYSYPIKLASYLFNTFHLLPIL